MLLIPDVEAAFRHNQFRPKTIYDGLRYARRSHVVKTNIVVHDDRYEINALVQGSERRPYKVNVDVETEVDDDEQLVIEGECFCPMGYNCKHVVAAIAAAAAEKGASTSNHAAIAGRIGPPPELELPPVPLSYNMTQWLSSVQSPVAAPVAKPSPKHIFFVFSLSQDSLGLVITLMVRHLKTNGQWGKMQPAKLWGTADLTAEPFVEDADLLRQFFGECGFRADFHPKAAFAARILPQLLNTNRCLWQKDAAASLQLASQRTAVPIWLQLPNGTQKTSVSVDPIASVVLPLAPPWYIDLADNSCGPLEVKAPAAIAAKWLLAPPLPPEQSLAFAKSAAGMPLPQPRAIKVIERQHIKPAPVLRLEKVKLSRPFQPYVYRRWDAPSFTEIDVARVEFDYKGARVPLREHYNYENAPITLAKDNGDIERILRNRGYEDQLASEIVGAGLLPMYELASGTPPKEINNTFTVEEQSQWYHWVTESLPHLQSDGWQVEMDPSFSCRPAAIEDWYSETLPSTENVNDWFSYELGVVIEGERVNLLPFLGNIFSHLKKSEATGKKYEKITFKLPDGRIIEFPAERLRSIAATFAELFDSDNLKNGRLEIGKLRAAELVNLNDQTPWRGPSELELLAKKIRSFEGIAATVPPPTLQATLRPYQLEGLAWLQFLREHSFGGILADDMGLGKTVQALAHILAEKDAGRATAPSLVIAPTSLMPNWKSEAAKFTPNLKVLIHHGSDRKEQFDHLANRDLIVTSYALLPRDREILEKQNYHLLILDEAQYIKNPRTQWSEIARALKANHRLCMTGTPMENHLGELWSLMHFLSPGYLGPEKQFRKIYRDPIEKLADAERRQALAKRVRPFIMRRKKEDVAKDLPEKTEIIRNIELDGKQRDLYETIRLAMHEKVQQEVANKGMSRSHIVILDALLKLRQVCCDPRLVKLDRAKAVKESAKLDLLKEMLPELVSEGRKILLFSQFTSMLELIEIVTNDLKIPFVRLTGETTDRETPVNKFQAGEVPLFLISLKAGGTGLNLTAADTVIHYDPWWNPAVETQATDRAHRIGQTKKVFVYKLVTTGTVEEKILAMQLRKKELVAGLLGEGAQQNLQLTKEDLNHLFDPL